MAGKFQENPFFAENLSAKQARLVKLREVSLSGSGTFQTFYCIQIPLCADGWWPDEVKKDYVAKWSFAMESYHNSSTCPPSREDQIYIQLGLIAVE